jgi:hypothetical protein
VERDANGGRGNICSRRRDKVGGGMGGTLAVDRVGIGRSRSERCLGVCTRAVRMGTWAWHAVGLPSGLRWRFWPGGLGRRVDVGRASYLFLIKY